MTKLYQKNELHFAFVWIGLYVAAVKAIAGYVEELVFRGFLFRAMEKDNLRQAIIISAVTFGAGHIVNLANTEDVLSVLLQVCYAIAVGFLFTILTYKCGSLWPCILSHMFINASSVFASPEGAFTNLVHRLFSTTSIQSIQICSSVIIILLCLFYSIWLCKKVK